MREWILCICLFVHASYTPPVENLTKRGNLGSHHFNHSSLKVQLIKLHQQGAGSSQVAEPFLNLILLLS